MQGKISKIHRTDGGKGILLVLTDGAGREFYLSLHKDWKIDFRVSKGNLSTVSSVQRVHEERLYPHSGPAQRKWLGEIDE